MWRLTLRVSVICATTVERVSRRGTVAISTSTHIIETQESSILGSEGISEDTSNTHAIEIKWLVHILSWKVGKVCLLLSVLLFQETAAST